MILPTKGIHPQRALISQGADILRLLDESKTVSRLWEEYREQNDPALAVTFDWFVLSLDLLFLLGAIELERGRIRRPAAHRSEEPLP